MSKTERKMIGLDRYEFEKIENNKPVSKPTSISQGESLFLAMLGKITNTKLEHKDKIESMIAMKAPTMDTDTEEMNKYKNILEDGITVNGTKYILTEKNAGMGRTQRTAFIDEKYWADMDERISMGVVPELTNIAKYRAARAIVMSSSINIPLNPYIVIVNDLDVEVTDIVQEVKKCKIDSAERDMVLAEMKLLEKMKKEAKQLILPKEELLKLDKVKKDEFSIYKSINKWEEDSNRRVIFEEISKPKKYGITKDGHVYAVYHHNQTEKIPEIEITESSAGYYVTEPEEKTVSTTAADGQGLFSFEFAEKLSKKLGLDYTVNAFQGRKPFMKFNAVRFDLKEWFKENGVGGIKDVFGKWHPVDKIDLIVTKSCAKFWHSYIEGEEKPRSLFRDMDDYNERTKRYGWDELGFGVAKWAKPLHEMKTYTDITYQHIYALGLNKEAIWNLSEPLRKVLKKVRQGKDIAYIKAFMGMAGGSKKDEDISSTVEKLIDVNERMLFDGYVRNFIMNQFISKLDAMKKGRIPVKGRYQYLISDVVALAEHIIGMKPQGFLDKGQSYCSSIKGNRVLIRNPVTLFAEVVKTKFIKTDNKWVQHLNNVTQLSIHSTDAIRMAGSDQDGDEAAVFEDEIIWNAVIDSPVIINEDDKKVAPPVPYTKENIIKFELTTMHNLTGIVTNINTYFQNLAMEETGDVSSRSFETSICKFLQGEIIDSQKKGIIPEIPLVLHRAAKIKPYFMQFVYGEKNKGQYQWSAKSDFCKFVEYIHKQTIEANICRSFDNKINPEYLNIEATSDLLIDESKFDEADFIRLQKELKPIYTGYNVKKQRLNKRKMDFKNQPKWKRDKEVEDQIREEFKQLVQETKEKCNAIIDNQSVLASVAASLCYGKDATYDFCYDIALEGILENLKANTDKNEKRTFVYKINQIQNNGREWQGKMKVVNGVATINSYIEDVAYIIVPEEDAITFEIDEEDGIYDVVNILGQHFYITNKKAESKVATSTSASMKSGKSTYRELIDKEMSFMFPQKPVDELVKEIIGQECKIGIVKNGSKVYTNIYSLSGEHLCAIARDSRRNNKEEYSMFDFDGATIRFKAIKSSAARSFKAIVDVM